MNEVVLTVCVFTFLLAVICNTVYLMERVKNKRWDKILTNYEQRVETGMTSVEEWDAFVADIKNMQSLWLNYKNGDRIVWLCIKMYFLRKDIQDKEWTELMDSGE